MDPMPSALALPKGYWCRINSKHSRLWWCGCRCLHQERSFYTLWRCLSPRKIHSHSVLLHKLHQSLYDRIGPSGCWCRSQQGVEAEVEVLRMLEMLDDTKQQSVKGWTSPFWSMTSAEVTLLFSLHWNKVLCFSEVTQLLSVGVDCELRWNAPPTVSRLIW